MKKCFDNIKSLKITKIGLSQKVEAVGMFSSDGEYVEFSHSVMLEGPVEAWLCDVERSMRWNLKEFLKFCRVALKKVGVKREKWVKEWAGQVWSIIVTVCRCKANHLLFFHLHFKTCVHFLHFSSCLKKIYFKCLAFDNIQSTTMDIRLYKSIVFNKRQARQKTIERFKKEANGDVG